MHDDDPDLDFEGFETQDFIRVFQLCGERNVTVNDVEEWLEEGDADPGHQVLSLTEIADEVTEGERDSSSSNKEGKSKKTGQEWLMCVTA